MEIDNDQQKAQPTSDSESESDTSSSGSSGDFSDDVYLSHLGPDGLPWGTKPYQFEPMACSGDKQDSASNDSEVDDKESLASSNDDDFESRLTNLDWCSCGRCEIMDEAKKCLCCREIPEIMHRNDEVYEKENLKEKPNCITESPPFETVCLDHWVLQVAEIGYVEEYGGKVMKGLTENEKKRKLASRQLVWFCWEACGEEISVKLPSCALKCIRARFPI